MQLASTGKLCPLEGVWNQQMLPMVCAEADVPSCLQFMASAEAQKRYWARSFAGLLAS